MKAEGTAGGAAKLASNGYSLQQAETGYLLLYDGDDVWKAQFLSLSQAFPVIVIALCVFDSDLFA